MKVSNKKTFYLGIGITCIMIVVNLLPDPGPGGGSTGNANMLNNLSLFEKLLALLPGFMLIMNGIYPDSILGKLGGLLYDLFSWVHRENKK